MRCPVSVLVISILGLLWAAFRVFGYVTLAIIAAFAFSSTAPLPPTMAMYHDSTFMIYTALVTGCSLLVTLLLIAGCVGSLRLRRWAPRLMLIYGGLDIVLLLISGALNFVYTLPKTIAAMPPTPGISPGAMNVIMMALSAFGLLFNLALPIIVLVLYTRVRVKNAFLTGGRAEDSAFPVQPAQ